MTHGVYFTVLSRIVNNIHLKEYFVIFKYFRLLFKQTNVLGPLQVARSRLTEIVLVINLCFV